MEYISTRGDSAAYLPSEALIKGLADDGGLFVPKGFPAPFDEKALKSLADKDYGQLALEILRLFFTDFTETELKACIDGAYNTEKFDDPQIAPLVKAGGAYFLELFHGATLAFKDMALSLHPRLMKLAAQKTGLDKRILILTATSGDTGKAAMEGFCGVYPVLVFYPKDGVSRVQELQMTTQEGEGLAACAVRGNFDDAQTAVKSVFADKHFAEELASMGVILSSANSINIGRLIPQIVYYFYGYFQLVNGGEVELGEKVDFCVPTGNFGNILAAYYAKKLGLPVKTLICASNENKVLADFFNSGIYDAKRELYVTNSPSMDILISSNLERLLYHVSGEPTKSLMESLAATGAFRFDKKTLENEGFIGLFADETQSADAIAELYEETGYIMDTHTAVAYDAYMRYKEMTGSNTKTIITSTASPFKFAKSVMSAIDMKYAKADDFALIKELAELLAGDVPAQIDGIECKPVLHDNTCDKNGVKEFVEKWLNDRL